MAASSGSLCLLDRDNAVSSVSLFGWHWQMTTRLIRDTYAFLGFASIRSNHLADYVLRQFGRLVCVSRFVEPQQEGTLRIWRQPNSDRSLPKHAEILIRRLQSLLLIASLCQVSERSWIFCYVELHELTDYCQGCLLH